jgi:hypothetical protein
MLLRFFSSLDLRTLLRRLCFLTRPGIFCFRSIRGIVAFRAIGFVDDCFALHRPQLRAIGLQNLNEISLLLDHSTLLHDQHRHEAVRGHENDRQHGQQTSFFLGGRIGSRNRHHRCATEQSRQDPPQSCLTTAGTAEESRLRSNATPGRKPLIY